MNNMNNSNETENAIVTLVIVMLVILALSFTYKNIYKNTINNKINNSQMEPFINYQDTKTKTINWCNKMKSVGLLSTEQYDECISTFTDASNNTGILPKDITTPNTGLNRNYSLYDTKKQKIIDSITEDNTNNVMLVSNTGMYMACRTDNTIYFIQNIDDPLVNQQDIRFTLVPQNNNIYALMSAYGKYLKIDQESTTIVKSETENLTVSFSGSTIDTMSSWNVTKYDSNQNVKAKFETAYVNNYFLSSSISTQTNSSDNNSLTVSYGDDDSIIWQMIAIPKSTSTDSINNSNVAYLVTKENILSSIMSNKSKIICLSNIKDALTRLQDNVRSNYVNIDNHVKQVLNNMDGNGGSSISNDDMNTVNNNLLNMKNNYLQQIQNDINKVNSELYDLNKTGENIENDYKFYLNDLSTNLDSINFQIEQNNIIMNRQKNKYDTLNSDYSYIDKKKNKAKNTDTIAEVNSNLISTRGSQNSSLLIIYPIIIFISFLIVIYLIYVTYKKFMSNVYYNYLD